TRRAQRPADLVLAVFAEQHYVAYLAAVPKFEREHGVKVDVQLVDYQSLEARLESAIVSNTQIADLNEISEGTLGFFTRGPQADFGFMDLTERVEREGLDHRVLAARYTPWTVRGHVYALPHDVHPVMLAYRRDLIEQLGIDVDALQTWDDFVAMGQRVTQDLDGDGIRDRFALDLPLNGQWGLQTLLRQRGMDLFNARGEAGFNTPAGVDTLIWYLHQTRGPQRIAYEAGDSQSFYKAVNDGLVLFILTPDWRSHQFQLDEPSLSGKLALMPLPAWEKGGRRTSTWGMTGLTISKNTKNPELAWELAKFLYYNPQDLGQRFLSTNIISPLEEAWNLPEFHQPNPFFSNQRVGEEYARLAPQVPPVFTSPIYKTGQTRLDQAVARSAAYYEAHGDDGLREAVQRELADAARYLKMWSDRNGRLTQGEYGPTG
ncbi:MAG TPA: extracellular solute-binding protein, partial [Polyangiaceae bacterium]|nr:extracellular solute-binding protein [Polyangiaceae bacterium]